MPGGTTLHIDQIYIEWTAGDIEGSYTHLDEEYMKELASAEVDDSLYLPDMFALRFDDPGLKLLTADLFKPGIKVKISIQKAETTEKVLLMKGEVTALEPDLNSEELSMLTVRGYDLSHKMNRVRHTQTFLNMTDSDIARKLAQASGLLPNVTSTPIVYPYLMQANQTDWEFLMERAERIGFRLFVEGKKLYFQPPPPAPPETPLKWAESLGQFRARLTTVDQPTQVTVRGWDPKGKAEIIGVATSPTNTMANRKDNGRVGGSMAQSAHSVQGKVVVVDRPVYNQSEAQKVAQAMLDKLSTGFIQAEGVAGGNPRIVAGSAVVVDGVGQRFSGKYLVTRSLHRYNLKTYMTHFWVSGGNGTMTITDLLHVGSGNGSTNGGGGKGNKVTNAGVMIGLVTNNADKENLGRVKVKFPTLNTESYWCRLASTMAGPVRGIAFLPEVNDEVVVAFQHGDPNNGVVLGALWNGSDKLPKPLSQLVTGGQTIRRVMKSRLGHEITIDDSPDPSEGIILIDKTEKNMIQIIAKQDKIKIEALKDIEIISKTGNITLSAFKDVKMESTTAKTNISGQTGVDISSPMKTKVSGTAGVNVEGATVDVNGTAKVAITGTGMVEVKGGIVKLN